MQPEYVHSKLKVNVSTTERLFSLVIGAGILFSGAGKNRVSPMKLLSSGYLLFRGLTGHCAVYSAIGKHALPDPEKNINIRTIIYVSKPRREVYAFWRRLENLPLFMQHLESVATDNHNVSEWVAKIPGGLGTVKWQAKIVNEVPGSVIGWSSLPGSQVENAGKVEFRDTEIGGTEIRVNITYRPPLGDLGTAVADLLSPLFRKMIENDIENYKIYIEKFGYRGITNPA